MGNAFLSFSCKSKKTSEEVNEETVVTMRSEDLTMTVSRNGLKSYHFTTPLMEQYGLSRDPYTRYPEGVFVETFQDSTEVVESTLRANEAIYYEKRDLWMASGNVVASGSGNTLYTEQLFWDAKTDRIYSNVSVKVVDANGVHHGEGLLSDKNLEQWEFMDYEGTISFETAPNEAAISGEVAEEKPAAKPAEEPKRVLKRPENRQPIIRHPSMSSRRLQSQQDNY